MGATCLVLYNEERCPSWVTRTKHDAMAITSCFVLWELPYEGRKCPLRTEAGLCYVTSGGSYGKCSIFTYVFISSISLWQVTCEGVCPFTEPLCFVSVALTYLNMAWLALCYCYNTLECLYLVEEFSYAAYARSKIHYFATLSRWLC